MKLTHTMRDGSTVRADAEGIALVQDIERRHISQRQAWIEELRALGVKAAHPDDGWVHRECDPQKIHMEYPHFNDGLGVGELLALGQPFRREETRIVRVIKIEDTGRLIPMRYYTFEPVGMLVPPKPEPPSRRRWRRLGR